MPKNVTMIKRVPGIFIVLFLLMMGSAHAQKISGGFKAGYNINFIDAPAIVNNAGETLEEFSNGNGFHVGAIVNYEINNYFGLRTNLLYTQRGAITNFKSEDTYLVLRSDEDKDIALGKKDVNISVNNSYLEIPLLVYGQYKNFELAFGPSMGLMVTSGASGSIEFEGEWRRETVDIESNINHKYYSNRASSFVEEESYVFTSGFVSRYFPRNHSAYFELDEKDGALYKSLNFGLTAEVNYYFNKGLFIGLGYYHGLNDVTRNSMDVDLNALDSNRELKTRDDEDKYSSLRISIGFRF